MTSDRRGLVGGFAIALFLIAVGAFVGYKIDHSATPSKRYASVTGLPSEIHQRLDFLFNQDSTLTPGNNGKIIAKKVYRVAHSDIEFTTWAVDLDGRTVPCLDQLNCLVLGDSVRVVLVEQRQNPGISDEWNELYFAFPLKRFWRERIPTSN